MDLAELSSRNHIHDESFSDDDFIDDCVDYFDQLTDAPQNYHASILMSKIINRYNTSQLSDYNALLEIALKLGFEVDSIYILEMLYCIAETNLRGNTHYSVPVLFDICRIIFRYSENGTHCLKLWSHILFTVLALPQTHLMSVVDALRNNILFTYAESIFGSICDDFVFDVPHSRPRRYCSYYNFGRHYNICGTINSIALDVFCYTRHCQDKHQMLILDQPTIRLRGICLDPSFIRFILFLKCISTYVLFAGVENIVLRQLCKLFDENMM